MSEEVITSSSQKNIDKLLINLYGLFWFQTYKASGIKLNEHDYIIKGLNSE